LSGEIS